MYISIKH